MLELVADLWIAREWTGELWLFCGEPTLRRSARSGWTFDNENGMDCMLLDARTFSEVAPGEKRPARLVSTPPLPSEETKHE